MPTLDEFIAQSLVQIIEGIRTAQTQLAGSGGEVVPNVASMTTDAMVAWSENSQPVMLIDFDVAVTAVEGKGSKAGIAVLGPLLGAGGQVQSEATNSAVSRISFKVPVAFPVNPKGK